MSTFCEVPFEPLGMNGSNYISWSAHIHNVLRTMVLLLSKLLKLAFYLKISTICQIKKKNACCVIVVLLTSCLKVWTKILQIIYKRRRNFERYVLMHIAFGNSSRQYAKRIVTTKIKKKKKSQ